MWGWLWRRHRHDQDTPIPDPLDARVEEADRRRREYLAREIERTIERLQAEVDVLMDGSHHRGHSQ